MRIVVSGSFRPKEVVKKNTCYLVNLTNDYCNHYCVNIVYIFSITWEPSYTVFNVMIE